MTTPLLGGCMCGAVRYACSVEPVMAFNCHCRDCQRATGGAFVPALIVRRDAVKVTGEVKYFNVCGDSGQILSRGFCPTCGSRLFGKPDFRPELMAIFAGSLDDPSSHKPVMNIYTDSAQSWDFMDPLLPKLPKAPQLPGHI
jgi:hypothetical protein